MSNTPNVHHIWCNSQRGPVKGCIFCDPDGDGKRGMWAKYPYDPETATGADIDSIVAEHFPSAVARPGTGPAPEQRIHQ